jgi:hypothetical protein
VHWESGVAETGVRGIRGVSVAREQGAVCTAGGNGPLTSSLAALCSVQSADASVLAAESAAAGRGDDELQRGGDQPAVVQ